MKTFNIEFKATGDISINADTPEEAVSKFEDMRKQDLISSTDEFDIQNVEQVWGGED